MKYFIAEEIGRTFILRMERGDFLKEKSHDYVKKKKLMKL